MYLPIKADDLSSSGEGQPLCITGIPSATATATYEHLHADATVHVDRILGPQVAIAFPAPLWFLFMVH
jgi:hypothetical protein